MNFIQNNLEFPNMRSLFAATLMVFQQLFKDVSRCCQPNPSDSLGDSTERNIFLIPVPKMTNSEFGLFEICRHGFFE